MGTDTSQRNSTLGLVCRGILSIAVWALYAVACASPAIQTKAGGGGEWHHNSEAILGIIALLFGWAPDYLIPWSANLFLTVGWILLLFKRLGAALVLGIIASLVGLMAWQLPAQPSAEIERLLVGSYFWEASFIIFALGTCALWVFDFREGYAIRRTGLPVVVTLRMLLFVAVALVATWILTHGCWEGELRAGSGAWSLDLDRAPVWSPPEIPPYERFHKTFDDLPGESTQGLLITRMLNWDRTLFDFLLYFWGVTLAFGIIYLLVRGRRDPVLHGSLYVGAALTIWAGACFGDWLLLDGGEPPAPEFFGLLGVAAGSVVASLTYRERPPNQMVRSTEVAAPNETRQM